jgi:hypothetical protein
MRARMSLGSGGPSFVLALVVVLISLGLIILYGRARNKYY